MIQLHTIIGLTISLFFTEWLGLYPGGIIVPVYLSLYVDQPFRIFGTVIISFITLAVFRLLNRYVIIYGRRRFVILIAAGGIITMLWSTIFGIFYSEALLLQGIGWVIPGLIANSCEKQGTVKTLTVMCIVTLSVFFTIRIITFLFY
jgi:poly-gamma-glutamate biosynthesis protein PgsC/CapC